MALHHRKDRGHKVPRRVVLQVEWHYEGRLAIIVEVTRHGNVEITIPHPERVDKVGREIAAAWLVDLLPRLSHDERYALLFED